MQYKTIINQHLFKIFTKLLQIFYLDRENEELLLKVGQSTERQTFNRFDTPPEEIDKLHNRTREDQDYNT